MFITVAHIVQPQGKYRAAMGHIYNVYGLGCKRQTKQICGNIFTFCGIYGIIEARIINVSTSGY